jgi:hypothetical protein
MIIVVQTSVLLASPNLTVSPNQIVVTSDRTALYIIAQDTARSESVVQRLDLRPDNTGTPLLFFPPYFLSLCVMSCVNSIKLC